MDCIDVKKSRSKGLNPSSISKTKGFTLTEIAIVIAVIGTIIGAIFVAASSTQYRVQLNQGTDELSLIVNNMHALYASQNASAIATTAATGTFEQQLKTQNVFPKEMSCGTYSCDPWDTTTANGSAQIALVAAGATTPAEFTVTYAKLPPNACVDMLIKNSLAGSDTSLVKIVTGSLTCPSASCTLPINPVIAASACPVGAVTSINWYFTLGS